MTLFFNLCRPKMSDVGVDERFSRLLAERKVFVARSVDTDEDPW